MFGFFKRRVSDPGRRFLLIFSVDEMSRQMMCNLAEVYRSPYLVFSDFPEFAARIEGDDVTEVWLMENDFGRFDDSFKAKFRELNSLHGVRLKGWKESQLQADLILFQGMNDGVPPDDPGSPTASANVIGMPQIAWHANGSREKEL